jgi:hypothetical protein
LRLFALICAYLRVLGKTGPRGLERPHYQREARGEARPTKDTDAQKRWLEMAADAKMRGMSAVASSTVPDARGHFGPYGGRYVPETLMQPLKELEEEYFRSQQDPEFQRELQYYLREFCGRPTPLYFAERLTRELGGAKIYLKREDLLHTGAHKINNAIGQVLLARSAWARPASSPRRARASTASPPQPSAPCSA